MPRQSRLDAPGTLHHVMGRGIEGAKIFRTGEDRKDFLARLGDLCKVGALRVYAWALLHNHLLLKSGNQGQRRLVVRVRKMFCRETFKKYGYSGARVARFRGVTASLANRYASSERLIAMDQ